MAPSVLWVSPLPPIRSGVSDYALELLPELARRVRVRVVAPPGWSAPTEWPSDLAVVPAGTAPEPGECRVVHLGNNPHHEWVLPYLSEPGAVVVAHDLVLHHLMVEVTLARGQEEPYAEALAAAHPEAGPALARARRWGYAARRDAFLFPARRWVLAQAAAVIVHSEWAARQVVRDLPTLRVAVLPMPAADPFPLDRDELRARLELAPDELMVMHLGFLTAEKGLVPLLAGLAAARRSGVRVRLVLVGEGALTGRVQAVARAAGLEGVTALGWVERAELLRWPAAADLGIVLRTPSAGETSAAALRFLAAGTPVAVGGVAQFLELPAAAAPRLTPGASAAADLARLVGRMAADPALCAAYRSAARRQWEEGGHAPAAVAARWLATLTELVS